MFKNKYYISLIFCILLVGCQQFSFAQGGFRAGIKLGGNYTRIHNQNFIDDEGIQHFFNLGFMGGASIGYNATYYNFGFTLGAFFKQYNQTFQYQDPKEINPNWKNVYRLNYLEVPLLFRVRPRGDFKTKSFTLGGPYFEIGIQGGLLLSANQSFPDSLLPIAFPAEDIASQFLEYSLGAVIGVGTHQVGTEHWALTHGFRLTFSLLDIRAEMNRNDYTTTDGVLTKYKPFRTISAGYILAVSYKQYKQGNKGRKMRNH